MVQLLEFVYEHWNQLHHDKVLTIKPNEFWTHTGSFWRMPTNAPALLDDLKNSELVIFKGDLNYRKLVGDVSDN